MKKKIEERSRKVVERFCRICLFGILGAALGSRS